MKNSKTMYEPHKLTFSRAPTLSRAPTGSSFGTNANAPTPAMAGYITRGKHG